MEIVKAHQKRTLTPTPSLTVHEYDMHESAIGGGIARTKNPALYKKFFLK